MSGLICDKGSYEQDLEVVSLSVIASDWERGAIFMMAVSRANLKTVMAFERELTVEAC